MLQTNAIVSCYPIIIICIVIQRHIFIVQLIFNCLVSERERDTVPRINYKLKDKILFFLVPLDGVKFIIEYIKFNTRGESFSIPPTKCKF